MKKLFITVIALIALGFAGWRYWSSNRELEQLKAEKARLIAAQAQEQTRIKQLEHKEQHLADGAEIATPEEASTVQDGQEEEPSPNKSAPAAEPETEQQPENEPESPDATASREERIIKAQMGIVVDMAYKDLFDVLKLSGDAEPRIRDLLIDYAFAEQQATVDAIRKGDVPASRVLAQKEAALAELRGTLQGILGPEEMEAWDEYEKYRDQNLYENLLEGQLAMLAPGISQTNREIARQVIAEELDRSIEQFEASEETYTMDHFNAAQSRALQRGLDRLVESFPEEQFLELEKFVKIAEDMFRAQSQP